MKSLLRIFVAVVVAATLSNATAQSPAPDAANTFHIMAIWEPLVGGHTTGAEISHEMDRLIKQLGRGNRYNRVGFAFIYRGQALLRRAARLASEKGLVLGPILCLQTHGNADMALDFTNDLRNFAWKSDGRVWNGKPSFVPGSLPPFSSSRYCDQVRKELEKKTRRDAREILAVMKAYPGTIAVVNPLIEQGLYGGKNGETANGRLIYNDVGPYATTEFRDWLRHTGRYDDAHGAYAGQGAPEAIVGPFVKIQGRLRSPFYDDPNPGDANHTGKSFNQTFGTKFKSWKLRYWDLENNPGPITNPTTDLQPQSGPAFVDGGFEPPAPDPMSPFWRAWIWVNQEQCGKYPPGNPKHPAFGFAQVMSHNYVKDVFGWLMDEGLPKDMLYAHQVPTEALGKSSFALMQARTMAMGVWTGYVPACRTVGITRFGPIDPALMTQYAPHWGIFEWHPAPGAPPNSQRLYDAATRALQNYWSHGCRFLFAGWWQAQGAPATKTARTFPLADSRLADAIHDFLSTRPDVPLK